MVQGGQEGLHWGRSQGQRLSLGNQGRETGQREDGGRGLTGGHGRDGHTDLLVHSHPVGGGLVRPGHPGQGHTPAYVVTIASVLIDDLLADIITHVEQLQQAGEHLPPVLGHGHPACVDQLEEVLHVLHVDLDHGHHCHHVPGAGVDILQKIPQV